MGSHKKNILHLSQVQKIIDKAIKSETIFCIGVDGPTASGKTIFANLLSDKIKTLCINKSVIIVPLDHLLIERKFRTTSLQKILEANLKFEHEAELHMDFHKIHDFVENIKDIKSNVSFNKKIVINKLYSREDDGKCSATIDLNLDIKTILIFEGHYTIRPELWPILDNNFIILANRENLIKRKIDRVSNYRDITLVKKYFDYIDEPSYLSNYSRFANDESIIIDNTNFSKPEISNFKSINRFLNLPILNSNNKLIFSNIHNFIYGNHGIINKQHKRIDLFNSCLTQLSNINGIITRIKIHNILNNCKLKCEIAYYKFVDLSNFEIGFHTEIFGNQTQWIISSNNKILKQFVFWEGGGYSIDNYDVKRIALFNNNKKHVKLSPKILKNILKKNNQLIFSTLLNSRYNKFAITLLDEPKETIFIATALEFSQFTAHALGDFLFLKTKSLFVSEINQITSKPNILKRGELKFTNKQFDDYFHIDNQKFLLTEDFLILKTYLNKDILKKLSSIYFNSYNQALRKMIFIGLISDYNQKYISAEIKKIILFLIGFFPSSMTRLYSLKKLGILESNVMAANIYDIKKTSIDSRSYLEVAAKNSLPIILQISLNASGQGEDHRQRKSLGYLNPKNGVNDFTSAVCNEISNLIEYCVQKKIPSPLFGIGLDHVDVRGDFPKGRSKRFIDNAVKTETVTHFTLDGSDKFKPKQKSQLEIMNAYIKVFQTSLSFWGKQSLNGIDLELCTGELNYIGGTNKPHYPDGKEIGMLPYYFKKVVEKKYDKYYGYQLLSLLKLYVGNLGTNHHEDDVSTNLRIGLAGDWQKSLIKTNFISPVLHGTTGSSNNTFDQASENCFKINIAGTFLKFFLEGLDQNEKNILKFTKFDHNSKYLCANLDKINKNNTKKVEKILKKIFLK